jgi:site-specific recombinase XerD
MSRPQETTPVDVCNTPTAAQEVGGRRVAEGDGEIETTLGALALAYVDERRRRRELRPGSVSTTRYALSSFVRMTGWDLQVKRLRPSHVEKWMERGDHSPATLRNQLSIVRTFCKWLVKSGHIKADPTAHVASPRQPRYLPRGLQHPMVTTAFGEAPDTRASLILSLMVQEGLRCCEVAELQIGDVDFADRHVMIRGKGGHERVLPVTDETWQALCSYLSEHPAQAGPLIRSFARPHRGITSGHISVLVSEWLHGAGVPATAHALRHTAATDMLRGGAHLRDVQTALGHQSLATTQRYLPLVVHDLRKAMGGRRYNGPPPVDSGGGDVA